jgi:hypothetical protein
VNWYGGQRKQVWFFSCTALWYTPGLPLMAIRYVQRLRSSSQPLQGGKIPRGTSEAELALMRSRSWPQVI